MPVLVAIYGGGYGQGDASQDVSAFINTNENQLIAVTMQYRWVQRYIALIGGDPYRVTIAGESAGGGSVMLHATAQDGSIGTMLFRNLISASPFLSPQQNFSDPIPTQHYYDFARSAGCPSTGKVFDCLVAKVSPTLQYAITDGTYIRGLPSAQLFQHRNNANEGSLAVLAKITTQNDLITRIKSNFPNFSDANVAELLSVYQSAPDPVDPNDPKYETDGYGPGTAINVSQVGIGQQQRGYNMYAEAAAVCPSYWLANAFAGSNKSAYHYQYSVPFAVHGSDASAYYGPPSDNQGPDFVVAFRSTLPSFAPVS
ncbi:uncharacterized protein PAC_18546 [Phialocephala subalpina]|uniref:Carboxylesterase type B domain-containing protein n=1 Tax=Phialocephala subalpina TaxID=576137 RepID=A0A1L7XUJ3_9HELO|nr:uncharacterized protein PAC_18546 [Phialocephala subalpina]